MRKFLIALLVLTLLVVGAYLVYRSQKPAAIENVLPAGPVLYFRSIDMAGQIDAVASTKTWQALKGISVKDLMVQSGLLARNDVPLYDAAGRELDSFVFRMLLRKTFGQDMAVAVYPAEQQEEITTQTFKGLADQIVVVTRLPIDVDMSEIFTQIFRAVNRSMTISSLEYRGKKIYRVKTNEGAVMISYAGVGGLLILSQKDNLVQRCLDTLAGAGKPLEEDPRFTRARNGFLGKANFHGYVDAETIWSGIRGIVLNLAKQQGGDPAEFQDALDSFFSFTKGLEQFSLSAQVGKEFRLKTQVRFDRRNLSQDFRSALSCPPQQNQSLSFIPAESMGYQWTSCLDFDRYWRQTRENLTRHAAKVPGGPSGEQMLSDLDKNLGINIEQELLPALGKEFGGALLDWELPSGSFPVVKLLLFLKVNSQGPVQKVIDGLIERQKFFIPSEEEYAGQTVRYLSLPVGLPINPGYTFVNGYLVVASGRDVLRQAIDAARNGPSLAASPLLKMGGMDLTEAGASVLFLRLGPFAQRLAGLLEVINDWMTAQDAKRESFKAGVNKKLDDLRQETRETRQALLKAREEKAQLTAEASVPPADPQLLEDVRQKLAETRERLVKKQEEIDAAAANGQDVSALESEKSALTQAAEGFERKLREEEDWQDQSEERQRKLRQLEDSIARYEKDMKAAAGKQEEISRTLKAYDRQVSMPQEARDVILESLLRPVLKGLSSCPVVVSQVKYLSDLIEASAALKIE